MYVYIFHVISALLASRLQHCIFFICNVRVTWSTKFIALDCISLMHFVPVPLAARSKA